jgi:hypothetical protein
MPKKKHRYFQLGGSKYKYIPDSKTQYYGYCIGGDVDTKNNIIAIGKKCQGKPRLELDTLIHEMLHALAPFGKEEWVNNTAYDIAEMLWQLGYRKTETDGETTQTPKEGDN